MNFYHKLFQELKQNTPKNFSSLEMFLNCQSLADEKTSTVYSPIFISSRYQYWSNNKPAKYKTFVGRKVLEIMEVLNPNLEVRILGSN